MFHSHITTISGSIDSLPSTEGCMDRAALIVIDRYYQRSQPRVPLIPSLCASVFTSRTAHALTKFGCCRLDLAVTSDITA
jgi:hypothetical protein